MYVSGDLSDPIDRFEYEGNELIDDCHGFPLVFMKNSYNYLREKPIIVYFETSRSYNNWNGETRTSYFWECCEDVETFGGNSKIKYFIHPDDKELIISFGPSTSDFERYDLDDFSIDDSDIDEINEVSFRGELPEEYKDGIWLQVTFADGYSGLWFMDSNKKELVDIIKRDIPYYKDTFELYNNGEAKPVNGADNYLYSNNLLAAIPQFKETTDKTKGTLAPIDAIQSNIKDNFGFIANNSIFKPTNNIEFDILSKSTEEEEPTNG
jgi:hypothetical protein